jgi:hypothetical protein
MRRLAALTVIAAIATFIPMVALASVASGSCCSAKNAPSPVPMSCCKTTKCSMSKSGAVPVAPTKAETTPLAPKITSPGAAVLDGTVVATLSTSVRTAANRDEAPAAAVTVDRRLAILSTYLI